MGEQPRDAENTTRAFFKEYMVNRNVEATLGWLTDDVHWIGTGKGEYSCGKEQVLNALEQEFSLDPDAYQLIWEDIRENRLTPDCAVMQGRLTVVRTLPDGKEFAMGARLTSACVRTAEGFRVASIHASAPAGIQEEGEFFPLSFAESVSREYARRMGRSALELLGKNIPGGMLGTYLESGFPLYYVNDRMLAYLGYTYEEFSQATRGRVANCIHPQDRERVYGVIQEAFGKSRDYEVRYRIQKKSGQYIHVYETGSFAQAEDGRDICLCVVRDISAQVEAEDRLKQENLEKERQASRYDQLFQSVLCGIMQWKALDREHIVFKNANRESIRILGYASIWRIRSLVTLNSFPTSSSVLGWPSSSPNRSTITWRSLSFKSPSRASICSLSITDSTFPSGVSALLSATKSPRLESSSSPMGVSKDAGSLAICMISITLSSDISRASASSVTDGS